MNPVLLETLNEAQQEAVTAPLQPILVLAGAGTGKTRVLVHRIAFLSKQERLPFYAFLAVTFTNKAAQEMGARVGKLIRRDLQGIWLGTFHALTYRMLQRHSREAELPEPFQLIDEEDQLRLIRQLLPEKFPFSPKEAQHYINRRKDEGLRSFQYEPKPAEVPLFEFYRHYEDYCRRSGIVDFGELLLRSCELLEGHEALREHYRRRFQAILVDEFQDTNRVQYRWLRLLARDNLFVVGDDDQAIYSWRGAEVENLFRFRKDFPNHLLVRLEQNYRSTRAILEAANAVIRNNRRRLGKTLWTAREDGERLDRYCAEDEMDEAEFVAHSILDWLARGGRLDEVAILYRTHALSRPLELALQQAGVPYRVYGGVRFFERAEIKDALAYLRLVLNRHDDLAFLRAVQRPPRGIGAKTVAALQARSERDRCSLWQAAQRLIQERSLSRRAQKAVAAFMGEIERLSLEIAPHSLRDQVAHVLKATGLLTYYEQQERGALFKSRVENLKDLVSWAAVFVSSGEDDPLQELVTAAILASREDREGKLWGPHVQLMTLHAAKGLEFSLVFIVGLEEEIFPGKAAARSFEEERRLFYVGMTRARDKLYLSYAASRFIYGQRRSHRPSPFLKEVPEQLVMGCGW